VAVSNIFLGMQQALVWSATIFIMIDYLGQVPVSTFLIISIRNDRGMAAMLRSSG
jgi:hypothetical protein